MDFTVALSSVKNAIDLVRTLQGIDKDFDAATYKAKIAELMSALASAQQDLTDAREEVSQLKSEAERLKKTFHYREDSTIVYRGHRYDRTSEGLPMGMPYCERCETVDGVLIHLALIIKNSQVGNAAICPQCKSDYGRLLGHGYPDNKL
jgi:hypothetical protein